MIYALDIPWGFQHPDITYWKDVKIHVYKGPILPPELRRFRAPEFSYHQWQEAEANGQDLPPSPPSNVFKPRDHQKVAAKKIYDSYQKGDRGFLLADKTGLGKGLAGSTKIPTPNGFTTMKQIKEGDSVLGRDGKPTKVLEKYNSKADRFYKLTFSDGTTIKADADHRWLTQSAIERERQRSNRKPEYRLSKEAEQGLNNYLGYAQENRLAVTYPEILEHAQNESNGFLRSVVSKLPSYGRVGRKKLYHPQEVVEALYRYEMIKGNRWGAEYARESVKTTQELFETQRVRERSNHSIQSTQEVIGEKQNLPIPPYVLGVWLGDGCSHHGSIYSMDEEIIDEVSKYYEVLSIRERPENKAKKHSFRGLKTELSKLYNISGKSKIEKHIPQIYLNGDIEQRTELLKGLLDTDGSISVRDSAGGVSFSQRDHGLFWQVYSLIASFGWKVTTREKRVYNEADAGYRIYYELLFYPDKQVFNLPRKADILKPFIEQDSVKKRLRYITKIEEINKDEEYYCISVDSKDHMYLATESYIPTHNTLSTLTGITAIAKKEGFDYKNKAKVLIVAPKSVLPQWRNTILSYPVSTTVLRPLIINYEQLNKLLKAPSTARVAKKRSTKNRQIASKGTPTVDWDFIVFDESHKLKNYPSSAMSRAAERIGKIDLKYVKGKHPFIVFSTATPGDTPLNFSIMAGIIAPLLSKAPAAKTITPKLWGGFLNSLNFNLTKTKTGWSWITVPGFDKNSPDPKKRAAYEEQMKRVKRLQRKDAQRIGKALLSKEAPFIMRSPTDIAGWPEQQLVPLPIQLSSGQETVYQEAWTRFRNWLNLTPARKDPKGALVETLRYRQKSSLLKVDALTEFIIDQVEAGNQVFVSIEFLETLDNLKTALIKKKVNVGEISGRNVKEREQERIKFQKGVYDVILVTPTEGISLHAEEQLPDGTVATSKPRVTIVTDVRQNSLQNVQLLGRAHRDGKNSIAYLPYLERTVDEKIIDSFTNKFANLKTLTGSSVEDAEALERLFRETAAKKNEPNRLS